MTETIHYTADVVVLAPDSRVLLIERRWAPFEGRWALPGGHVDAGEYSREAAARELVEETGVRVASGDLSPVGTWAGRDRDPRGWYATDVYLARVPAGVPVTAGDDARDARWWPLDGLPPLAFDHADIIAVARLAPSGTGRPAAAAGWPEGVFARYLTVAGATVDLIKRYDAWSVPDPVGVLSRCSGCWRDEIHATDPTDDFERESRTWAQQHAEQCRALPRPAQS
ncbi:NUDIX domain-containing protein [Streptomyces paromomycinus]|uniref:DNA hydrolase n=1 Tax=Streptomyces paromomycinus TaxID=92743 RepID=A0A401W486_STREY|nr:NUDIX hydrolase [Streptomyces paromomycinus]GCD44148.1 DNA hydrolase [Streptomyces paromomycinus]